MRLILAGSTVLVPFGVFAQTATSNLEVRITIEDQCEIISTEALNFGTGGVLTSNVDASSTLQVACTDTTPYDIGLGAGRDTTDTTMRQMTSGENAIGYFATAAIPPTGAIPSAPILSPRRARGDAILYHPWPRSATDHACPELLLPTPLRLPSPSEQASIMMRLIRCDLAAAAMALVSAMPIQAQSLRVSPVSLEVQAPGAATTLTVRNEGRETITVQARSFRWIQQNGQEHLQRTSDVVVSPPAVQLAPGTVQTIRVVRTSKSPVRGEEAYRVLINEVPDQTRRRSGAVNFATELRIPVFFVGNGARHPAVAWSLRNTGNATVLVAQNQGDTRLRLSDLTLTGASGASASHPGLAGYVLGGATMQWPVAPAGRLGASARMKAQTNLGAIDAGIAARQVRPAGLFGITDVRDALHVPVGRFHPCARRRST